MACTTVHCVFFNYLKSNGTIGDVFYIEADSKTKSPYITTQCTDDPTTNTFLCEDKQGDTRFLVSIFQSSYTKGINNRQLIIDYMKQLRGQTIDEFEFWDVSIENSWDGDKNIDGLYNFNCEVLLRWNKSSV